MSFLLFDPNHDNPAMVPVWAAGTVAAIGFCVAAAIVFIGAEGLMFQLILQICLCRWPVGPESIEEGVWIAIILNLFSLFVFSAIWVSDRQTMMELEEAKKREADTVRLLQTSPIFNQKIAQW